MDRSPDALDVLLTLPIVDYGGSVIDLAWLHYHLGERSVYGIHNTNLNAPLSQIFDFSMEEGTSWFYTFVQNMVALAFCVREQET